MNSPDDPEDKGALVLLLRDSAAVFDLIIEATDETYTLALATEASRRVHAVLDDQLRPPLHPVDLIELLSGSDDPMVEAIAAAIKDESNRTTYPALLGHLRRLNIFQARLYAHAALAALRNQAFGNQRMDTFKDPDACRFCGSAAETYSAGTSNGGTHWIACSHCGASTTNFLTPVEALAAWHRCPPGLRQMHLRLLDPVRLDECPPGLFLFNETLGFRSEYSSNGNPEAFVVATGATFWGGAIHHLDRRALMVRPVSLTVTSEYLSGLTA